MEQEKPLRLVLRQLKDIQAQADKISRGDDSNEALEAFARYSIELKSYISTHVASPEVKSYLLKLPEINFSRTQIKLWQYLIMPHRWFTLYKDYQAKNNTLLEINQVKGKYTRLAILIKGLD